MEINTYQIINPRLPEDFAGFRIAQISDLHNAEFGEGNERLLRLLSQAEADIIVITGDLIDSRRTDTDVALAFCEAAVRMAPVYYVTGNHEARTSEYEALKTGLEEAGVVVLEDAKVRIEKNGSCLTLMGLQDPSFTTDYLLGDAGAVAAEVLDGLKDAADGYTVLLSHRPELFDVYVRAGIDLVFSGHAHGGQIRLPVLGGLVAPNQGLFPKYDAGRFTDGTSTMLVSRGIGNSLIPIRVCNRPEIVVAELWEK